MRLPRLLTGGAIVAVLAGTAACGLQSLEPKLELKNAASSFASDGKAALRLSFASSASEFRAFTTEADAESGDPGSTDISDADLKRLLGSSITIDYDDGGTTKTADDATRVDLHIGSLDAGEIRVVRQVLYARADLAGLEKVFPDIQDGVDSARDTLTGADGETAPAAALKAPADALFDGKWVSLDTGPGSWFDQQLAAATDGTDSGSAGGTTGGLADDAPAKLKAIAGKAFAHGVTVKRLDGDDRLGDHLVATVNLRTVYTNIRSDLAGLLADPSGDLAKELPEAADVPDRDVAVSFWVKDGKLTRVELDAAQFLDKPSGALVLRADNLAAEKISAPSGAVKLDPQAIADQTGASLDQLFSGAGAADAHTIAEYVDQDIADLADGDGAAPSLRYLKQAISDMDGLADGLAIEQVGQRIQVTVGGQSACLTLAKSTAGTGTVTDGPCA